MKALTPHWKDYELIDSGGGEKLERFGKYILARPEPAALWPPGLSKAKWQQMAHARFLQKGGQSGEWQRLKKMPERWNIAYRHRGLSLKFQLALTAFKHVGIFPEQAVNWDYIYAATNRLDNPRVLNLFAYTGGASLAARAAGADVIHCDSVKQVLNWARTNMQASRLSDIRWLLEDAFKFVQREARRGNTYQGIILDPPVWGYGPKGEKWKLEEMIDDLTRGVIQILDPKSRFLVFNNYSLGLSPLVIENLVLSHAGFGIKKSLERGELYLQEQKGRRLPAGVFVRFQEIS